MRAKQLRRETRVDRIIVRFDAKNHTTTPQGYLRVWGTALGGDQFLEYDRADGAPKDGYVEFVPKSEASSRRSIDTLKHDPITFDHPPEPLTSANTGEYKRGTAIAAKWDGNRLRVHLQIEDEETIRAVKEDSFELSLGYTALIDRTPGKFRGRHYDAIQRGRIYNHIAIVPMGRAAGAAIDRIDSIRRAFRCDRLAISKIRQNKGDAPMAKQVKVGADTFEVATQVADKMQTMEDEIARLNGDAEHPEGDEPDEDDEEENNDQGDKDEKGKKDKEDEEDEKGSKGSKGSESSRKDGVTAGEVAQIISSELGKFQAAQRKDAKKQAGERKRREDAAAVLVRDVTLATPYLPQSFKFDGKGSAEVLHAAILSANSELKPTVESFRTDAGALRGFLAALTQIQPAPQGSPSGSATQSEADMTPMEKARKVRADQVRKTQAQLLHRRIGKQAAEQVRWEMEAAKAEKANG